MTDYISKTDLLLALAELPQDASKREVLSVIYDMPTVTPPVVWKPIPSTGGVYWAGSDGSIYRPKSGGTHGGFIKQNINKHNGYAYVSISVHNKHKTRRAHRLIAEAFFGDANGLQVNHKDGNKANNAIDNLEYCTQSENMRHAFDTGLEKKYGKKVIDLDTKEVFNTLTDAANAIGGSTGEMVNRVCSGKRSHYRNHHYAYYDDYINGTIPAFRGKNKKKASVGLWR